MYQIGFADLAAVVDGGVEQWAVIFFNCDLIPLRFTGAIIYVCQTVTSRKRTSTNVGDVTGDSYAGQRAASHKHTLTNAGDATGDSYAGQCAASRKCIITNAGHATGDSYVGQSTASSSSRSLFKKGLIKSYQIIVVVI